MATQSKNARNIFVGTIALAISMVGMSALAPAADAAMKGGQPGPVVTPWPDLHAALRRRCRSTRAKQCASNAIGGQNDYFGSEEPYFIFNSAGNETDFNGARTHTFSGIAGGDWKNFSNADHCVYRSNCSALGSAALGGGAPARYGIGLSIELWESNRTSDSVRVLSTNKIRVAPLRAAIPDDVRLDHGRHVRRVEPASALRDRRRLRRLRDRE